MSDTVKSANAGYQYTTNKFQEMTPLDLAHWELDTTQRIAEGEARKIAEQVVLILAGYEAQVREISQNQTLSNTHLVSAVDSAIGSLQACQRRLIIEDQSIERCEFARKKLLTSTEISRSYFQA
jgi:hypothetical protein